MRNMNQRHLKEFVALYLVAEFMVETGIIFSVSDNLAFIKIQYFKIENRAFKPPSEFSLTSTLFLQVGSDYTSAKYRKKKVFKIALNG